MPVVLSNQQFPYQVGASPFTQSFSTQLNYGKMLRELTNWNSNLDTEVAGRMINNRYRQIIDRRSWYGLKVRGNAFTPNVVNNGTCTTVQESATVQGIGTTWTPALIGLQFRQSFTQPFQTIVAVNQGLQQLTLDTPFPGTSATSAYYIAQAYMTFGGNIKRFKWATNQLFGWPIKVNVPVEVINAQDTWRMSYGWATTFATRPPTPDGQYQVEIWPTPYPAQIFPFEAYTQPPNLEDDSDTPVAWISSDFIVTGAISDALLWRPKQNKWYDPQTAVTIAATKSKEWEERIVVAENADEGLEQQAVTWDYDAQNTAVSDFYAQTHDV